MKKIKSLVNQIESVDIVLGTAMVLYLTLLIVNLSKLF
jgi:hypothetical protein